jgi:predicted nuclease of predicted toxin-antitoxin system
MKVWLDANMDPAIAPWMGSEFGVIAAHVRDLTLQTLPDQELFQAARRLNVTLIVTKDSDFVDLVVRHGPPPRVLRLTCGNLPSIAMRILLKQQFPEARRLLEAGDPWVEIG